MSQLEELAAGNLHGEVCEGGDSGASQYRISSTRSFDRIGNLGGYCVIELPTVANVLVALDPMSRTVPATSTSMTAIITAYSAMSWPSCCDHNLRIINCDFPLFLRLVQNEKSSDPRTRRNVVIGQLGCVTRLENEMISLRG